MGTMLSCVSCLLFIWTTFKITPSTSESIERKARGSRLKHYNDINPKIYPLPPEWHYIVNNPTSSPLKTSQSKPLNAINTLPDFSNIKENNSPTPEPTIRPSPVPTLTTHQYTHESLKINVYEKADSLSPNPTPQPTYKPLRKPIRNTNNNNLYLEKYYSQIEDICKYTMRKDIGTYY
eukprot:375112_1